MRIRVAPYSISALRKKSDFHLLRTVKVFKTTFFRCRFTTQPLDSNASYTNSLNGHNIFLCAFVTSKRFSKKATVRNHTRRKMRAALIHALQTHGSMTRKNMPIVKLTAIPHHNFDQASFAALLAGWTALLNHIPSCISTASV